jgi:hypothetical protein
MTSQAQEVCEDFTGLPCEEESFQLSESFTDSFQPAALGHPLALVYFDADSGDWASHIFSPDIDQVELGVILNNPPTPETLQKLVAGGSLIFHDPQDDFVVISGVEWDGRGLIQSEKE